MGADGHGSGVLAVIAAPLFKQFLPISSSF